MNMKQTEMGNEAIGLNSIRDFFINDWTTSRNFTSIKNSSSKKKQALAISDKRSTNY